MLEQVLDVVADLQDRFAKDASSIWFRGHRSSVWQLTSTLHRHVRALAGNLDPPMQDQDRTAFLREEGKSLYRLFKADAWPLLRPEERSEWGGPFLNATLSLAHKALGLDGELPLRAIFCSPKSRR